MGKISESDRFKWFQSPRLAFVTLAKIINKSGEIISPTPTYLQEQIFEAVEYFLQENKPLRMLVLKPRQAGSSTVLNWIIYWWMRTRLTRAIWVTDTISTNAYHRSMLNTYAEFDPFPWGNDFQVHDRRAECSNRSTRYSSSAESKAPGVGGTWTIVGSSETAKFGRSGAAKDAAVIMPQLKAGLADEPFTLGVDESTPDGIGYFSKLITGDPDAETTGSRAGAVTLDQWKKGERGNGMIKIVTGWYDVPEYQIPLQSQDEFEQIVNSLTPEERRIMAEQGDKITAERIKWRRATIDGKLAGSENIFQQEYLESEERCFLVSGSPRFDMEGLIRISTQVKAFAERRRQGVIRAGKFVETNSGEAEFHVWDEEPKHGCSYLVTVDSMTGKEVSTGNTAQDRNSIMLWRAGYRDKDGVYHPLRLIARALPSNQDDPTPGSLKAAALSQWAGGCVCVLEINNSGLAWVEPLKQANVRLWRRRIRDDITGKILRKIGFSTDQKSREIIISALADCIREENKITIPCPQLSSQLQTFVRNQLGKPEAATGSHDDDVIASALACELEGDADLFEAPKKKVETSY
tara:strand:- start:1197 stop:2930 length:1734 start_codon:yes stop_codon:yes gene_type:complete